MTINEAFALIDAQEDMTGIGVRQDGGEIVLMARHDPTGLITEVTEHGAKDIQSDALLEILRGKRESRVLNHMTRVVGYMAMHHNMNISKQGEIRDRQKGNYAIEAV